MLFEVYDAAFLVGVKAGLLDDIVKPSAAAYLLELKFRVAFIIGYKHDRTYPRDAVNETAPKLQINNPEHIHVVNLAVKYPPAPFYPVSGHLITGHLQSHRLEYKHQ